jgi:hypothetical protein
VPHRMRTDGDHFGPVYEDYRLAEAIQRRTARFSRWKMLLQTGARDSSKRLSQSVFSSSFTRAITLNASAT